MDATEFDDPRLRPPAAPLEVHYSRLKGGPTSMGVVGRVLTTVLTLLLAYAVYLYVFQIMLGETSTRMLLLCAVVAVPVLSHVLRRVWRPARVR
jgi:hypothetical protein